MAVHEALEKVAQKIDPKSYVNKLTVSRSRDILASTISKHARRRVLPYDIIYQECLNDDLKHLEVSITHTDVDDNSISITFDLTLILLVHHITNTYSHTIQDCVRVIKTSYTYSRQSKSLCD